MVALFLAWLRTLFEIDESRLRVRLSLHEGLDLAAAKAFWSDVAGIPIEQLNRPYRAKPDSSIRRAKHPMGCVGVVYSRRLTHRMVVGLVEALMSAEQINPG